MDITKCQTSRGVAFVETMDDYPEIFIEFRDDEIKPGRLKCFNKDRFISIITNPMHIYRNKEIYLIFPTGETIIYNDIIKRIRNHSESYPLYLVAQKNEGTYKLTYFPIEQNKLKNGIVSGGVVYLNSSRVEKYELLKGAIDKVTKSCNYGRLGVCGVYNTCYSFMGICFDRDIKKEYIEKELSEAKGIVGYFLLVLFPDMIEIYNFCIPPENRNRGIGTKMMKSVTEMNNGLLYGDGRGDVRLWLGIDIANPMANVAGNLYIKSGFRIGKPNIQYITPHGSKANYFIQFEFNKKRATNEGKTRLKFENIIGDIRKLSTMCKTKLVITTNIFEYLLPFLDDNKEHAGYFRIKCNADGVGILTMPVEGIVPGGIDTASVPTAKDVFINFHTHPKICYTKGNCTLGWPSSQDMTQFIKNYVLYNTVGSMVVSVEGVYLIYITPDFQRFISLYKYMNDKAIKAITDAVKSIYKIIDNNRKIKYDTKLLDKYIEYTRSFKLKNLEIKDKYSLDKYFDDNKEINIFKLSYMSWDELRKNKIVTLKLEYFSDNCEVKPDVIEESELIGGEGCK